MTRALRYRDELCERGRDAARWQVVDPEPRDGWIKLFDKETHQEEYKPLSDINDAIVAGSLTLARKNAPRVSVPAQHDPTLDNAIAQVMEHIRLVEGLKEKYKVSLAKAYVLARDQHKCEGAASGPFPSRASIYRYIQANRNRLPVLLGAKNKGNRNPRYTAAITELIAHAASGLYLVQESTWSLKDLATYVNDRAVAAGWLSSGQAVSRAFIRKVVFEDLSIDPEIDRMDPKLVAAAKSIGKNRISCAAPFERIEQDAVHLPFVVQTPNGETSNVYLIHAIDCCTGMPVGWYMVIGGASESDGLKCVESILYSKRARLDKLGLSYDFDVYGTPHQLVFDNGPETRGERMRKLVRLDIDVMHCKSRHAHGKPFIERLNRSLKEALQTLPGCTRMDGRDGQRDPVKLGDRLMTIEELERWVVRWYYESWADTVLKRHLRTDFHDTVKLGGTPAMRWKKMTQELAYAMPLSPPLSEWMLTLYEHEVRTLSRKTGVTCRGFNYRGDNLPYLVQKHGEKQLNILVNPDDYRQIYVDEGGGQPLVTLTEEFVDDTTPAYSFSFMQERLKEMRAGQSESAAKAQFRQDVHGRSMETAGKTPRKKQTKAEKNRAVADQAKASSAVRRAIDNPVRPAGRGATADASAPVQMAFDDVAPLPVLSRINGEVQG
ncbi:MULTISPECIES: DDE-type integrase/transposase/recombinase [unclassified Thiomonas]|uniref:DDE-type integrase/transposase/recombinase n=1 Tax=unclassified Thiomonas TaxID=2625466 RepID=UPI0004DBB62A|nr:MULTISPECIES: DDE-type integrase/transposase/recombinase [unclassified Thiomonas]CDW93424.1 putative integrase, catalytic region [Thiomonas sp. CB2]VDY05167.1 putative integrase, catalytic region [Thiomonas sp. Bio17B3]VDY07668.1 putative integrase, catalytic region [Thiomonas sp. Sup16B3]VDY13413.1 putative integrase, catalytic region [Thiomonas sp. OC7]VDY17379.1 putative integrase, catalytic region [Thiomonas sp. CB2]